MRLTDYYHDPAHSQLAQIFRRAPEAQELLKTAQLDDDLGHLQNSAFAEPMSRRFPIHTPEQAVVSYLYAKYANASVDDDILSQIDDALTAYGVNRDALEPKTIKRAALQDDECLFPDRQAYPIRNAEEVKLAEQALVPQANKLLPMTKAAVFAKLAHAADVHGVKLSNTSLAYAGRAGADPALVMAALGQRFFSKVAAEDPHGRMRGLEEIHDAIKRRPSELRNPDVQAKIAGYMAKVDREFGFEARYGRDMIDPVTALYSPEKVAAADAVPLGDRYSVSQNDLAALPASFYADALGPDFAGQAAPNGSVDTGTIAQVLGTLPADMMESFVRSLRAAGVKVTDC